MPSAPVLLLLSPPYVTLVQVTCTPCDIGNVKFEIDGTGLVVAVGAVAALVAVGQTQRARAGDVGHRSAGAAHQRRTRLV